MISTEDAGETTIGNVEVGPGPIVEANDVTAPIIGTKGDVSKRSLGPDQDHRPTETGTETHKGSILNTSMLQEITIITDGRTVEIGTSQEEVVTKVALRYHPSEKCKAGNTTITKSRTRFSSLKLVSYRRRITRPHHPES